MAWLISWQAPLEGRVLPAMFIAMPDSTSDSARATSSESSAMVPGWRSSSSPALRAMATARPSTCSPVSRLESSQSAQAEMFEITSPIPAVTKRSGACRITSRSTIRPIGLGTP